MPEEFWIESAKMLLAGVIVAAIALPFGLIAWAKKKREANPLLPRWQIWWGPWSGFEVVVVFLVVLILIPATIEGVLLKSAELSTLSQPEKPPIEETAEEQQEAAINKDIRRLWASVLALPLQLCLLVGASRVLYPRWWQISRPPLSSRVVLAIIAWAVLTPLVLCVNSAVSILFKLMDWPSDTHPFVKLAGRPFLDSVLFIIQACIAAPIIEEAVFRGAVLAWTIGSRRPQAIPDVPSGIRPWLVALSGLLFAAAGGERKGPLIFVLVLIACLPVVLRLFRRKQRIVGAVFSSAILFASVHSRVWPSPIPLFVLGLGLGWLAVRTRSLLVPMIVHGLFNAVSTVYVLRSAS